MLLKKYLNSFLLHNIFLFIVFCLSVTSIESIYFINILSYTVFHFIIIYLCLYYYKHSLYIILFMYGLGFDLLLITQIGPHLLAFMALLMIISQITKYLKKIDSIKIYLLIIFFVIGAIFFEMILSKLLFNYTININNLFYIVIISLLSSFPILFFFKKIDKIK